MKFRLSLLFAVLLAFVSTGRAQNLHPKTFDRLEGTVSLTARGITTRATLQWQAPDQLRVDVQPDAAALVDAVTIVATGDETRLLAASTRRIKRLAFNVVKQPWRGWGLEFGGPANFALFGTAAEALNAAYKPAPNAPPNSKNWAARADVGRFSVRDYVRTGGSGDSMFYAAFKRGIYDRPAQWQLGFDPATKFATTRRESDERGRLMAEATLTYSADGVPQKASVRDANAVVAEFVYDLKPRAEAFAAGTFAPEVPAGQIIEDEELRSIADYEGKTDASSRFNLGVALAMHAEDLPAAFAAWDNAARQSPQATAPQIAIFDAALTARQHLRAQTALDSLEKLLGADHAAVLSRRAGLGSARRDWGQVRAALDAAHKSQPQNLDVALRRANELRLRGDFAPAQQIFTDIIAATSSQIAAQVDAAEALAAVVSREDAPTVLAALPKTAPAQQLARALLALSLEQTPEGDPTNWPDLAVASLATAYERSGQDDAARPLWQMLSDRAPQPIALAARRRLMALIARRGEVADSLKWFKDLLSWTNGENDRGELEADFLTAWVKADRLDVIKTALQQRAVSTTASPDDRRLWQRYLEGFGTPAEVLDGLRSGLARERNSPWWLSRLAERKAQEGLTAGANSVSTKDRLDLRAMATAEALKAVTAAVAAAPDQPYYAIQRALILAQKVVQAPPVTSAGETTADRKAALAALDELQVKFPDDADVAIAVALQKMSVTKVSGVLDQSEQLLQTALRDGPAGRDGSNRHEGVFPARQMLAIALRRANKTEGALEQFETALQSASSATESLGIAVNVLNMLVDKKQPGIIADYLVRLAHEPWPFSDAQQLLDTSIAAVLRFPEISQATAEALKANADPYAVLVAAKLREKMAARAKAAAMMENAPEQADADSRVAARQWDAAFQLLKPLMQSKDDFLAAQSAAILGENSANFQNYEEATKLLSLAQSKEPQDLNLRVALASAQIAAGDNAAASATRDAILRGLPSSFENLRQATLLTRALKQKPDSLRLTKQALDLARVTAGVSNFDKKSLAFLTARTYFDTAQMARGLEIYNALAGPTRLLFDRAAAMMDAEAHLRAGGSKVEADNWAKRLQALNLTPEQLQEVTRFLARLGA